MYILWYEHPDINPSDNFISMFSLQISRATSLRWCWHSRPPLITLTLSSDQSTSCASCSCRHQTLLKMPRRWSAVLSRRQNRHTRSTHVVPATQCLRTHNVPRQVGGCLVFHLLSCTSCVCMTPDLWTHLLLRVTQWRGVRLWPLFSNGKDLKLKLL